MAKPFFLEKQKALKMGAIAYVVLLLLSHWQISSKYVWIVAAFFSIAMNFTYLIEAISLDKYKQIELVIASTLVGATILGLIVSPLLIVAAIFAHGCWDLAKHFGSGVPFYLWYTCGCFLVDTIYGLSLLVYWQSTL